VLPIVALVADEGKQRIFGSGILRFNEQEALNPKAELGLSIHDDYHNMGIGTALLNHLMGIARKKKLAKIYLHVRTANDRAIYVYKKAGFVIEGKLGKESCINGEYKDEYRMAIFL
jgi:RimJ/RimL family protein N-acetyltransferase